MKPPSHFLSLALLFYTLPTVGGTIDGVSKSVAFLWKNIPAKETINGVDHEVWYKKPGTNQFFPKQSIISGTGCFVVSSNLAFLVTARHVAAALGDTFEAVLQGQSNEPLRIAVPRFTGNAPLRWVHHAVADISVYPLPIIDASAIKVMEGRALPLDMLVSEHAAPSRDVAVTALGFPFGLGAEGEFHPLSRESKAASGMLADTAGRFFVLQDPSVSGYSGGPLIESADPRVVATNPTFSGIAVVSGGGRCWGFVSGTFADETGGKMCRIVPARYAIDLVQQIWSEITVLTSDSQPKEGP